VVVFCKPCPRLQAKGSTNWQKVYAAASFPEVFKGFAALRELHTAFLL